MRLRTRRFANERLFVLLALGLASASCLALELVRERHFGRLDYRFLVWNLILAWIPLMLALAYFVFYVLMGTRFEPEADSSRRD